MSITKEHFDQIQRIYDQRQLDAQYKNSVYLDQLYEQLPQLKEIKDTLSSLQVARIKANLMGQSPRQAQLEQQIQELAHKRQQILEQHGISLEDLEPHYICPDCKDTGYTSPGHRCHCFTQAIINILYSQSGIKSMLNENNFDRFNFSLYDQNYPDKLTGKTARQNIEETVEYCKRFIQEFDHNHRNLLFYGETGVGKTFLTNCIARELLERSYSVLYLSAIDLTNILTEASFFVADRSEESRFQVDFIFDCDLLIIDDLGTEVTNSLKSSNLFNCLDKRLNQHKSTIISTNLSPKLINRQYSDRIFSRILGNYTCFKIYGDDLRSR